MDASKLQLPISGHINICEVDGRLRSMPSDLSSDLSTFTNSIAGHPAASVTREALHAPVLSRENAQQLFLPVKEPLIKRFIRTWYQQGCRAAVQVVAEESSTEQGIVLRTFFGLLEKLTRPKISSMPPTINNSNLLCPVRLLAWHPEVLTIAVVAWDDSVRLFSCLTSHCCILKTKIQRSAACLAWRPYLASELAVGCESGIAVWNRDPNNKTSMSCVTVLKSPNRAPVTSIAWNPQGEVLLSASSTHPDIYQWQVDKELCTPLPRRIKGGVGLLLWSPSSMHVLTASMGVAFYVWDTKTWRSEEWKVSRGRVAAACFSPCGSMILFSSSEEPHVYAISLRPTMSAMLSTSTQQSAHLVLDHSLTELEGGQSYGGLIQSMIWDPRGCYLAILSHQSDLITVYSTELGPSLKIAPCCLINGLAGEKPSQICFQPNFEEGSQLTIAWSSGRVQYFPFVYSVPLTQSPSLLQQMSNTEATIPVLSPVPQLQTSLISSTSGQTMYSPYGNVQSPNVVAPQSVYSPNQSVFSPTQSIFSANQLVYSPIQQSYTSSPPSFSPPTQTSIFSPSRVTPGTPVPAPNISSPISPLSNSLLRRQTQPW